jgi:60 kDa SS-A/Ro ribonucleoprotein
MATQNRKVPTVRTHEGGTAQHLNPELQLRRSVMACMLWEDSFYESGIDIAERIKQLVPLVKPDGQI